MKARDLFWALFDEGHDDQETMGEPRVGIILAIAALAAVALIGWVMA